jgi:antitoxin CcdA
MRMTKGFSEEPRPYRRAEKRGPKRAANVSIDAEILAEAKALGINLSHTLEEGLRKRVREEKCRRFSDEHREAIEAHNKFIDEHGIWSEKLRTW